MADDVDITQERIEKELELLIAQSKRNAALIPKGEPGECYYCGEEFARVVEVIDPASEVEVLACGHCRDKRGL